MPAVISIGAGLGQLPLIRAAKQLGYDVVAVDRSPSREALSLIEETIILSTYDADQVIESVLELSARYDFSAVLARTSGPALLTASRMSESLKIPGIPKRFADAAVSKSELRMQADALNIATPKSVCISISQPFGEMTSDLSSPWVVKPDIPLVGKENVYKVDDEISYQKAYENARAESYNDAVDVGSFVPGIDVGLMAIVHDGEIIHNLLYDEFATFIDGKVKGHGVGGPSYFSNSKIESLCRGAAQRLISDWRYQYGFAFFSFRVTENGEALLYEVNPGLCGDAIADQLLPAIWPRFDPFVCDVDLQMGIKPELPSVSNGLSLVLNGQLTHVNTVDEYLVALSDIDCGSDVGVSTTKMINALLD